MFLQNSVGQRSEFKLSIKPAAPGRINLVQQTFHGSKRPVSSWKFRHYSFSTISSGVLLKMEVDISKGAWRRA